MTSACPAVMLHILKIIGHKSTCMNISVSHCELDICFRSHFLNIVNANSGK